MNCDEAFDALTGPNSERNSALKWHLEMCPRCREMREVLAPALALFSQDAGAADGEITASGEASRLDEGIWGEPRNVPLLTPEAVRVAEQTAQALRPHRFSSRKVSAKFLAGGVICLLAAFGLFFGLSKASSPANRSQNAPVVLADQCLWTNRDAESSDGSRENSRWVVLSCVACHLEPTLD
jgi:hypothetical protein